MKKAISAILCLLMILSLLAGCTNTPGETPAETETSTTERLQTPANVRISDTGLITWDAVEHATAYVVRIGENLHTVQTNFYQVTNLNVDFQYSVTAQAEGYQASAPSAAQTYLAQRQPPVDTGKTVVVAVNGKSEVRSGHSTTLTATVTGVDDGTVLWEIANGSEFASIDAISGELTANSGVSGNPIVEVVARSLADESAIGSRVITVVSRPELTQAMLDEIGNETQIGFEGFVTVLLYNYGMYDNLYLSSSTTVKTAMNGVNWYAEYTDGNTGLESRVYYKNNEGVAAQVGVSLMNVEEYFPALNDDGSAISWEEAGLYNAFTGLKVSDFTFNEQDWRYEYTGNKAGVMENMVASANPYDFAPEKIALILEDGAVLGFWAESKSDYTLFPGYRTVQELTVAVNVGEIVEVPTVTKFKHEDIHDALTAAIANMRALENYSTNFHEMTASIYSSVPSVSGYDETVTATHCYFDPYTVTYLQNGDEVRTYTHTPYGFMQVSEDLYNSYVFSGNTFEATRAYQGNISTARPSFEFAAEIFTAYFVDEEDGSITYYVNETMSQVASTFYFGLGNDIALYGLFAMEYPALDHFTPYVTVKDGYIVEAGFYFNLTYLYGIVEITYGDFGTAKIPANANVTFAPRQVPTGWDELTINVSSESGSTADDTEVNAAEYLATLFGSAENVPFFGAVLGDTYGFGLTTYHLAVGASVNRPGVVFYYDVPLESDYTINSYLKNIGAYLISLGFEKNQYDEYYKGSIGVAPVDSGLDLIIYVWKTGN